MRLSARGVLGDMASDAPGKGVGGLWWRDGEMARASGVSCCSLRWEWGMDWWRRGRDEDWSRSGGHSSRMDIQVRCGATLD